MQFMEFKMLWQTPSMWEEGRMVWENKETLSQQAEELGILSLIPSWAQSDWTYVDVFSYAFLRHCQTPLGGWMLIYFRAMK